MKISAVQTDTDFTLILSEDGETRSASLSVSAAVAMSIDQALTHFCKLLGCPCACSVDVGPIELEGDEDDEDLSLYEVVFDPDTMLTEVIEAKVEH